MTIQTKRFIELSDILAVRLTCKHCGATLSFPIGDDKLKRDQSSSPFLSVCPSCHQIWAELGGSSYESVITRTTAALNRLREILHGNPPAPLGFSLVLEITPETVTDQRKETMP